MTGAGRISRDKAYRGGAIVFNTPSQSHGRKT